MKLEQLRKIIGEEVRAAVKEELLEVMTEAVKIASTPNQGVYESTVNPLPADKAPEVGINRKAGSSTDAIMEMLEQTKASMTPEEYKNIYTGNADLVQKPNFASSIANQMGMVEGSGPQPGLDLSKYDFVKKAGEVYKKSIEKDKIKQGLI